MRTSILLMAAALTGWAQNLITVCNSGCAYDLASLQQAVDAASPGDVIEIAAGQTATVTNGLVLRNKGAAGPYVTIRSSGVAQLQPGYRVTPADGPNLAAITAVQGAGFVMGNDKGAAYYRFHGIELVSPVVHAGDIVEFGTRSPTYSYVADHDFSDLAHDIIFDQCYIHGHPSSTDGPRRGIRANLGSLTVVNSWLDNFKNQNGESAAVGGWNGSGPFYFRNNHFEAAGIDTIFGGATPNIHGIRATGVIFLSNHYYRPWKYRVTSGTSDPSGACLYDANGGEYYNNTSRATYWQCNAGSWTSIPAAQMMPVYWQKNVFELKNAWHVSVEGNYLENAWLPAAQSQYGAMFLLNLVDSDPPRGVYEPAATVAHVVVRNNYGHRTPWVTSIGGVGGPYFSPHHDQTFDNNLFDEIGEPAWTPLGVMALASNIFAVPGSGVRIRYTHNTVNTLNPQAQAAVFLAGCKDYNTLSSQVTIADNIVPWSQRGFYNDCGAASLWNAVDSSITTARAIARNVVVNNQHQMAYGKPYPIVNIGTVGDQTGLIPCLDCVYPNYLDNGGTDDVGFTNYAGKNFRLTAASRYHNWGHRGKDPGADVDVVEWSTQNAVSGAPNPYLDFQVRQVAANSNSATLTYTAYDAQSCNVLVSRYPDLTRAAYNQADSGGDADRVVVVQSLTVDTRYFYRVSCSGGMRRDGVFLTTR